MIRRCKPMLGTFVEVAVPDADVEAIEAAFAAVARVQAVMSFHDEGSDLARLRRAPPREVVRVDPATVEVLALAAWLRRRSRGLFDVGCGRVLVAAGFLPAPHGVDLASVSGGADDIEIVDDRHVRCHRPVLIDLGGIAKGYAVDAAIDALRQAGVSLALVNAGGDLRVIGRTAQRIDLRAADGTIDGALMLEETALASSSNLDARRVVAGVAEVPHRGLGLRAVPIGDAITIVAPTCALADAMTKIAIADRPLAAAMLAERGGAIIEPRSRRRAASAARPQCST